MTIAPIGETDPARSGHDNAARYNRRLHTGSPFLLDGRPPQIWAFNRPASQGGVQRRERLRR